MEIVRNKSTETVSFPLTVMSLLTMHCLMGNLWNSHSRYLCTGQCAVSVVSLNNLTVLTFKELFLTLFDINVSVLFLSQFPNFIGLLLSLVQLSLFLLFGRTEKRTVSLESPA